MLYGQLTTEHINYLLAFGLFSSVSSSPARGPKKRTFDPRMTRPHEDSEHYANTDAPYREEKSKGRKLGRSCIQKQFKTCYLHYTARVRPCAESRYVSVRFFNCYSLILRNAHLCRSLSYQGLRCSADLPHRSSANAIP